MIKRKLILKIMVCINNGYKGKNNDIPIVRTRKVNTSVVVKNGYTVLIGGLFNSSESNTLSRFPFFSRIPLLGVLFKSNKVEHDQTELVIAITPTIINDELEESIPLPTELETGATNTRLNSPIKG